MRAKFPAFSVYLPCVENSSGIAMFSIGLVIRNAHGKSIPGTPLRLNLRKECAHRGVYDRGSLSTLRQGSVCSSIFINHAYCIFSKFFANLFSFSCLYSSLLVAGNMIFHNNFPILFLHIT